MGLFDIIINEFLKGFYIIYIIIGLPVVLFLVVVIIAKLKPSSRKAKEISTSYYEQNCPQCGGQLIRKNGKYGAFMGCSSYPRCKHTVNLN